MGFYSGWGSALVDAKVTSKDPPFHPRSSPPGVLCTSCLMQGWGLEGKPFELGTPKTLVEDL